MISNTINALAMIIVSVLMILVFSIIWVFSFSFAVLIILVDFLFLGTRKILEILRLKYI